MHAFPWREEETGPGRRPILRPTVDVRLTCGDLVTTTKALIDTGSPRCVMPRGIAVMLGLDLPDFGSGADGKIHLLGSEWPTIQRTVQLQLQPFDEVWEAEVDFVIDEGLAFGLLGYEGFLNRWAVSFNGYHGYIIVEPVESHRDSVPAEVIAPLLG